MGVGSLGMGFSRAGWGAGAQAAQEGSQELDSGVGRLQGLGAGYGSKSDGPEMDSVVSDSRGRR